MTGSQRVKQSWGGGGLGRRQGVVYAGLAKDLGWILSKTRSLWRVLSKG